MAQTSTTRQSLVHATLHDEDVLDCLFDTLESRSKGVGRRTLASCALVCKTWSDPASRALWRRLDSFHPLWALLAGRNFPPSAKRLTEFWQIVEPEEYVKEISVKEPDLWNRFLHRASHVREIGTASCREPELALLRSVIKHNGGSTFLPNLQRLVWRNGVASDTTLLLLASPSLRSLELDVTTITSTTTINGQEMAVMPLVDRGNPSILFDGLAKSAPYLQRLVVAGRQLSNSTVIPHLLGLDRMLELSLFREVSITPDALRSLLASMPALELLNIRLQDFASPSAGPVRSPSLRILAVQGAARDIAGLLGSCLDAPSLTTLSLTALDDQYSPDHARCLRALSRASFAPSLHQLKLSTLTRPNPENAEDGSPVTLEHAVLEPLAALRALEVVELHLLDESTHLGDADMRALARAWPRVRRLVLAYFPSGVVPPLSALRYFARYCPELRQMNITKMAVPNAGDVVELLDAEEEEDAEVPAKIANHPMQALDMRMTFGGVGPYDIEGIARFLDGLFPNLEIPDEGERGNAFASFTGTWGRIESAIRALRTQRGMQG